MKMKVLSLYDGISCGMVALERAGIPVERYVAYEIDENAIKVSMHNYPQIEHCGDVTKADFTRYKKFDIVIGGSPCQDFSTLNRTIMCILIFIKFFLCSINFIFFTTFFTNTSKFFNNCHKNKIFFFIFI